MKTLDNMKDNLTPNSSARLYQCVSDLLDYIAAQNKRIEELEARCEKLEKRVEAIKVCQLCNQPLGATEVLQGSDVHEFCSTAESHRDDIMSYGGTA